MTTGRINQVSIAHLRPTSPSLGVQPKGQFTDSEEPCVVETETIRLNKPSVVIFLG